MKDDRVYLINFLARLFGVATIFAGIGFLVSAYAIVENRVLNIAVGIIAIVMGMAFLVIKSVNADQLARIRRRMERPGSSESGR
jgi:cytochrome c biogenesis protein CcdA